MFSVVIPLYNKADVIEKTIQAVLDQTFDQFEVIVINDGSTDDSLKIVTGFSDSRIKIIDQKNRGVSAARNAGIKLAKYDFVAFLDGDDLWLPNYLFEQSRLIADFSQASMWGMGWGAVDDAGHHEVDHGGIEYDFRNVISNYFERSSHANLFFTSAVVIRRNAFNQVGLFDERIAIGEDLDMWYRIIISNIVVFFNSTMVFYRLNAKNRLSNLHKPEIGICFQSYIEKYDYFKKINKNAISYIHNNFAEITLKYYFGAEKSHNSVIKIKNNLEYSLIKLKYSFLYKSPYYLGFVFFKFYKFKKSIYTS
jgi:glycosyltransferase involved in cell wall biosynthesis